MPFERSHAAILFTDLVGSTQRVAEVGNRAWRSLLRRHDAVVRSQLRFFLGTELNTAGDGFVARFDDPVRAILCAAALRDALRDIGLDVRCGLHLGQIEGSGRETSGIAVHIGARVAAHAGAGEILVSRAVRDSVEGAGFSFVNLGVRDLRGVEGEWRLYRLSRLPADAVSLEPRLREQLLYRLTSRKALWVLGATSGILLVIFASIGMGEDETRPLVASFRQITSEPGVEDSPSLSPDGEWLVYSGESDGDRDIYLRSVGGERAISLTADSPADEIQPAFSPDGERVAFRSSSGGGGIFVMGRTGEGMRRVTREGFNPAWSPDGTRLAYGLENVGLTPLNAERRSEIRVVGLDGGDARRVSPGDEDALDPSWSPNGRRIAYTTRWGEAAGARMDIATISVDGPGDAVRVTTHAGHDWAPTWSGRYIYFVSNRGGSMNLWRIAVDEASGAVLGAAEPIGAPAQFVAHPSVSADGRIVAFSNVVTTSQNIEVASFDPERGALADRRWLTSGTRRWSNADPDAEGEWVTLYSQDRPEGDLYVMRADGTALRRLTSDEAVDRVPRWSPDGSTILYFSDREGPLDVWTIRPDGSGNRRATFEGGGVAAWSPDGSRVAANIRETVAVFDPSTAWDQQEIEWLPAPSTDLGRFTVNDWSPDGAHLAGSIDYLDTGIVVYSFRSRTYERITDFGHWPVWLPDSRRILFVSGGNQFSMVDLVTGTVAEVYSSPWDIVGPPRLTRDAHRIFYSRRMTQSDVWIVEMQ